MSTQNIQDSTDDFVTLYPLVEEAVDSFADYQTADFEEWLQVGLEQFLFEGRGAWSFSPAEGAFSRWNDPAHGMKEFYQQLPSRKKSFLRQAVANVLASLEASEKNVVLFEHLLAISSILPAPEILRVLPVRVGNGYFGLPEGDAGKGLLAAAILAVARLAAPRQESMDCLHSLITSHHFSHDSYAYSAIALIALCRADNRGLARHLALLRRPLQHMFDHYQPDDQAKRRWAEEILSIIGLDNFVSAISELEYDATCVNDRWLLSALLFEQNAQLRYSMDSNKLKIFRYHSSDVLLEFNFGGYFLQSFMVEMIMKNPSNNVNCKEVPRIA